MKKQLLGTLGLALLIVGVQSPGQAQVKTPETAENIEAAAWTAPESLSAEGFLTEEATDEQVAKETVNPTHFASEDAVELAQARRRTRGARGGPDFIGIGADFGYVDDVSFAVISKVSINEQVALRPSILIGDDFAILVPVTYEFNQFVTGGDKFQLRPYAGVGASYVDSDDDEDFNLLLTAGVDVPLSQRFTLNAQANLGVLNDTDFGGTIGVGYNFGRLFR